MISAILSLTPIAVCCSTFSGLEPFVCRNLLFQRAKQQPNAKNTRPFQHLSDKDNRQQSLHSFNRPLGIGFTFFNNHWLLVAIALEVFLVAVMSSLLMVYCLLSSSQGFIRLSSSKILMLLCFLFLFFPRVGREIMASSSVT